MKCKKWLTYWRERWRKKKQLAYTHLKVINLTNQTLALFTCCCCCFIPFVLINGVQLNVSCESRAHTYTRSIMILIARLLTQNSGLFQHGIFLYRFFVAISARSSAIYMHNWIVWCMFSHPDKWWQAEDTKQIIWLASVVMIACSISLCSTVVHSSLNYILFKRKPLCIVICFREKKNDTHRVYGMDQ